MIFSYVTPRQLFFDVVVTEILAVQLLQQFVGQFDTTGLAYNRVAVAVRTDYGRGFISITVDFGWFEECPAADAVAEL